METDLQSQIRPVELLNRAEQIPLSLNHGVDLTVSKLERAGHTFGRFGPGKAAIRLQLEPHGDFPRSNRALP